jgi:hypothetical protein
VVSYEDVGVSLGRYISDPVEQEQITLWISDAEVQIRLRLGDLSLLDAGAVGYVTRESVVLKVRNPDGKQNEKIDDYSFGLSAAQARGQVYISDEWWELLSPATVSDAFSTRPTFEADTVMWSQYSPLLNTGSP